MERKPFFGLLGVCIRGTTVKSYAKSPWLANMYVPVGFIGNGVEVCQLWSCNCVVPIDVACGVLLSGFVVGAQLGIC